jgi:hypothetical protein
MTPKEKANELCGKYYSRVEHILSEEYSPHERFIVKQCALIAVDEILESLGYKKLSDSPYTTLEARQYYVQVKQEIENL